MVDKTTLTNFYSLFEKPTTKNEKKFCNDFDFYLNSTFKKQSKNKIKLRLVSFFRIFIF